MVEDWKNLSSEELADYHIFKLRRETRRSPRTGADHSFFVLQTPDWINVIPLTPAGKVVMIHQFRQGTSKVTLEIPGGMVDANESDPAEAARRELLEETGYAADELIHIGTVDPNPAFLDNQCHTYLALGVRWQQAPAFDGAEDIGVEEVALDEIAGLIGNGRITHALVVAAFYHYENYRRV
ncbi:ADP-ribose pyrophosphatase [hydrothermal vent metagenome]|uniref:ADP-ribose pyrophosphatase n=2 Tax=hydrothermal vent metagenome TaxID=652676 RepID=A0A3B0VL14_9ZZZZ